MKVRVPFLNLKKQNAEHREEFLAAIERVVDDAAFVGGEEVEAFETAFAEWIGRGTHFVGCGNGTDAITLAAKALRLPPGSEAIVPASSFFATVEGLTNAGLDVTLVDVDRDTWLLDAERLRTAITPKTRLIVPVHLYGQMAPMDDIESIASAADCFLLEDAAQAHGASWKGNPVGYWGDIAAYSFYPGKNLGAFGDAGGVLSRDRERIAFSSALAKHGGLKKYEHRFLGVNSRLDGIQAAILRVKLKYLNRWNDRRREIAAIYNARLAGIEDVVLPVERSGAKHVYHLFVILVSDRDDFRAFMTGRGIETGIHYPYALHQLPPFFARETKGAYPNAERLAAKGVSLPICPTHSDDDVSYVADAIEAYYR